MDEPESVPMSSVASPISLTVSWRFECAAPKFVGSESFIARALGLLDSSFEYGFSINHYANVPSSSAKSYSPGPKLLILGCKAVLVAESVDVDAWRSLTRFVAALTPTLSTLGSISTCVLLLGDQ